MSRRVEGTEVTGDKEGHTHLYKSTLPPVLAPMLHRQGSGVKAYVYVCVVPCAQAVSQHVSCSANEVI